MRCDWQGRRDEGNALMIAILLVVLLATLTMAQLTTAQQSTISSRSFTTLLALRCYAESGISLAVHDFRFDSSGQKGRFGTTLWTVANDLGRDGRAGTGDRGENDGIPTPGEPNVTTRPFGAERHRARLMTWVEDLGIELRVIATVTSGEDMVTVERMVLAEDFSFKVPSALYVDPDAVIDLNGKVFQVDGRDHGLDGGRVSTEGVPGIATMEGDMAGTNITDVMLQIPNSVRRRIVGGETSGDYGEVSEEDLQLKGLFDRVRRYSTTTLESGTHTSMDFDALAGESFRIHTVSGDIHLSGGGTGSGILLVDGSLTISGNFDFKGLVLVNGDFNVSGGGTKVNVLGGVVVTNSLILSDDSADVTLAGNVSVKYSTEALSGLANRLANRAQYVPVGYRE